MKYLDVLVVISPARNGHFAVNVASSGGGEGNSILKLPFAMCDLAGVMFNVRGADRGISFMSAAGPSPNGTASSFGVQLFEALFQGETLEVLSRTEGEAKRQADTGVRIRLSMNLAAEGMAEVASLPWELMRRRDQSPLVVSVQTPVVRAFDTPKPVILQPLEGKLRILVLVSNPRGSAPLALQEECDRISQIWERLDNVEVDFVRPVEAELLNRLAEQNYHVLHYMGHGDFDSGAGGRLMLEHDDGSAHLVSGDTFAAWLQDEPLRLVFLNACNTGTTGAHLGLHPFAGVSSALIRSGVPSVVAMQFPISDKAAIIFAQTFYERIAQSFPVDAAVSDARKRLLSSQGAEWATPVLYMRAADGHLFNQSKERVMPRKRVTKAAAPTPAAHEPERAEVLPLIPTHSSLVPSQVPPIKPGFVPRPDLFARIRSTLLGNRTAAMAGGQAPQTATGLRAQGGFGKTQLAIAIANDPEVRAAFPDGVLWTTLGERPDDILGKVNQLIAAVDSELAQAVEREQVASNWRAAFAVKRCLIVIDDVWHAGDLAPFLEPAPNCARLITTRNVATLPPDESVPVIEVTVMTPAEARQLLMHDVPGEPPEEKALTKLVRDLDYWPLFVGLANGMIRAQVRRRGRTIKQAVALTAALLRDEGIEAFESPDDAGRNRTAKACLDASIAALGDVDTEAPDYLDMLAAFEEDADVPFDLVWRLWRKRGRTGTQLEKALDLLQDMSFFAVVDHEQKTLRLHDLVRDHLQMRIGNRLPELHKAVAEAIKQSCEGDWASLPPGGYGQLYLPNHLRQASLAENVEALLLDPVWMLAKASGCGPIALWKDYPIDERDTLLGRVGRIFRASAHVSARDGGQSPILQLLARLDVSKDDAALCDRLESALTPPALVLPSGSLEPPGALLLAFLHEGPVRSVAFSPDGAQVLTGSEDGSARLWDAANGAELRRFDGHEDCVASVAFSPDGARVLTGSEDGSARLWDAESGAEQWRLDGDENGVFSVAFSPDGARVLTGSKDGSARLWDAASGAALRRLDGHEGGVSSVAFSPNGARLLTGSEDKSARLWDAASGAELRRLDGHEGVIASVAFSPDGARVLTGSSDGSMRLWDAASGAELRRIDVHKWGVASVAFSPDGAHVLTGSNDNSARLWDAASGTELRRFDGQGWGVSSVAFSPDGVRVLTGSGDGSARLWDTGIGTQPWRSGGHEDWSSSVAFSPDGELVLTGSQDGPARLRDAASGAELRRFDGHEDGVFSVAFSPDGARVLTGSYDNCVQLWDAASGAELRRFDGHEGLIFSVAFSPDGARVLTGSVDRSARLWDTESGAELRRFEGHEDWVRSVAFSPDGARVLTGSDDHSARLWDAPSGAELQRFDGHEDEVFSVAISPDGARVLTGSKDGSARLWDTASGAELRRFEGHQLTVTIVSFSNDGTLVLTGSYDGSVRLWDATNGVELTRLRLDASVSAAAWRPDGEAVVIASGRSVLIARLLDK